jgi:seryl-tRNA synthetase
MEGILLKIPRSFRFLLMLIFALLASYLLWRIFFMKPLLVPAEFLEANRQGVAIAEKIVTLSRQSSDRIATISALDKENKISEALDLVYQELQHNKEMREQAVILSAELQRMTETLPNIEPEQVRLQALQAINAEVSLMNRLIDYNDYLYQLLTILRDKFLYNIAPPRHKIDDLIEKINNEAKAINELNSQFNNQIRDLFAR